MAKFIELYKKNGVTYYFGDLISKYMFSDPKNVRIGLFAYAKNLTSQPGSVCNVLFFIGVD